MNLQGPLIKEMVRKKTTPGKEIKKTKNKIKKRQKNNKLKRNKYKKRSNDANQ